MQKDRWFSRRQVAAFLGVSIKHFDDTVRPLLAAEHVRHERGRLAFYGPAVVAARVAQRVEALQPEMGDEGLFAGPGASGSPWLEVWREERARITRLDRLEREGRLVDRGTVRAGFGRLAGILRDAGARLQRQFGREAGRLLAEALDEAETIVGREFGAEEGSDEGAERRSDEAAEPDRECGTPGKRGGKKNAETKRKRRG